MTSIIASHAVHLIASRCDDHGMARKARPKSKHERRKPTIKAWRKHRDLTLARLSERLEVMEGFQISDGQLSRIERGEQPWNQDLLEALARILQCEPADLIMRDPTRGPDGLSPLWSVWEDLKPTPREVETAAEVIKTLRRTGTDG